MQESRSLDEQVAREIFGVSSVFPYSTDPNTAWRIVSHLEFKGWRVSIEPSGQNRELLRFEFFKDSKSYGAVGEPGDMAKTICEAGLKVARSGNYTPRL
jgi:hypothetical protein